MRHLLGHKKLNKSLDHRMCMLRNMATSLIENGRIVTSLERAKALKQYVEPMIAAARSDNFNARRAIASKLYSKSAINKLFTDLGPSYSSRNGGYTSIIKLGFRAGDAARSAVIQFVPNQTKNDTTSQGSVAEAADTPEEIGAAPSASEGSSQ